MKRMNDWIKESISNEGVYRTAPATPGLLIIVELNIYIKIHEATSPRKTSLSTQINLKQK